MFRQRLFLVTAGLLATGVAVRAQPLTLEAAIQEALAHNRSLRTARSATVEAEARIKEARASFYPRINVVESWQRGNLPVFVFSSLLASRKFAAANFAIDALNHPNPQGFFQTSVGIDQLLFDGGRARSLLRAESLRRDVTMSATDEAAAGLVLAVTQTYGRVLVAQAARRAAEAGGEAAREDLTRVRARRDAGMATEADVLSLAVHVSDLDQRRIQAEGDAAVARAELNRLMGSAIDRDYRLEVPAQAVDPGSVPDLRTLLTEAEARRP